MAADEVDKDPNAGTPNTDGMPPDWVSEDVELSFPPGERCPATTENLSPPMVEKLKNGSEYDSGRSESHSENLVFLMASVTPVFHEKPDSRKKTVKSPMKKVAIADALLPVEKEVCKPPGDTTKNEGH